MNKVQFDDPHNAYNQIIYPLQERNNINNISELYSQLSYANMFEEFFDNFIGKNKKYKSQFENWNVTFSKVNFLNIIEFVDVKNPEETIEFTFSHFDYESPVRLTSVKHNNKIFPDTKEINNFLKRGNFKQVVNALDIFEVFIKKVNLAECIKQQLLIADKQITKNDEELYARAYSTTLDITKPEKNTTTVVPNTELSNHVEEQKNALSSQLKINNVEENVIHNPIKTNNSFIKKLRNLFLGEDKILDKSKKP